MENQELESLFQKTKKMLLLEVQGRKYSTSELQKLKKLAAELNSNFYDLALEQFDVINNYKPDLTSINFVLDSPELNNLARQILGYDNPFEHFSRNDILKYFFNLPDNVAICQVEGDSMIGAGIDEGDNLLYLKTKEVHNSDLIIAIVDGMKYVKRYKKDGNNIFLVSENPNYPDFKIGITNNFVILGKVMQILKNVKTSH